jgi:hypothetical protein
VTLNEIAEAFAQPDVKLAVAKALAATLVPCKGVDVELRWAMIPEPIRLEYVTRVERLATLLAPPATLPESAAAPARRKRGARA